MTDVRVIVLKGASPQSWEEATRQVVRKAAESVGEIVAVDVVHQSAQVENGEIVEFLVTVHLSFVIDDSPPVGPV